MENIVIVQGSNPLPSCSSKEEDGERNSQRSSVIVMDSSSLEQQVGEVSVVVGEVPTQVEPNTICTSTNPVTPTRDTRQSPNDWSVRGTLKRLGRILTGYDLIISIPKLEDFRLIRLIKSFNKTGATDGGIAAFENLEEEVQVPSNSDGSSPEEETWPCKIPFNFPVFIIFISFLEWISFQYIVTNKLKSDLEYQPFRRLEIWRFYTEVFVHGSSHHLWSNLKSQLIAGSCLEVVHGWKRVGFLYMTGVVFGNLAVSVLSPMQACFGASGAVFALMTGHLASFVLNWKEMTNPFTRTTIILVFFAVQIYAAILLPSMPSGHFQVAHASHFGGALVGFLIGINILKNFRRKERDLKLGRICNQIAIILFFSCVGANIAMQMFLQGFYLDKVTSNNTVTYELCKRIATSSSNITTH